MHSQQWARVKAILESALATPEEIRIALVEEACKDDEEVLRDVLGLLAAHKRAETTDAFSGPFTRYEPPEVALPDRLVGPYRLIRLIGRGGMGSVYLADRADDEFQRQVALKVLRRGVDTEDVLARFMHERQILARLNHPNIATLYDGGAREDGRPYFAMEYVRGEPIVEHCDGRKMSVRQRLDLFRVVCQAVHYAHANLVVHRDLKPSNIFVTDDGTVKLLDFGIARLLRSDDDEATELRTRPGARWLTPDYAAPEQIRGEPVTTATDVYQLGVLLYELLTGTRPFGVDKDGTGLEARERGPARLTAVVTEETARHRSVELPRLRRQLAGDLETIVSQALQADPSRRYPSAEALAEDVRRHLVGLPLVARSDTMLYRITRFVKRHRSVSVAAALTVLAIVAGTVATAWQARVASIERDNARAEAAKAEQVNDFLQSMLSAASPTRSGRDVRVVEVLDAAVARVGDELADQPELEAAVRRTLGITY
ncbi:MAG TPA: serine/threonine-protein kinase, partial [Rhodothermales bacterium]